VEAAFPGECRRETVEEFDGRQGKVLREDRLLFRGLVVDRRETSASRSSDAGELLDEQLRRGEIELPWDEESRQWLHRICLAHRICPESGMPALDEEDWALIYHDLCEGKRSVNQLQEISVAAALRAYLGPALTAFLEREAPSQVKLPQGRRNGKITYFETSPPELSARLGDFLGMNGTFRILKGRVEVLYDILAPNFRTVQKTADLTSFWKNTYPEIKKELKRRYPRHPWP
jgi:ATP-dependent helicase HrpB